MHLRLVFHNIRSIYNVGAILRTAEGLGVDEVIFSGYTPRYDDPNLLPHLRAKLNSQIAKAALGAEKMVTQSSVADLSSWLMEQKSADWLILGLENNLNKNETERKVVLGREDVSSVFTSVALDASGARGSESLDDESAPATAKTNETSSRLNGVVLVLGEEVRGIPPEIREKCNFFLEIPMFGRKESFNVSVAAAIALWELLKPTSKSP